MRVLIAYYSKTGNTEAAAMAMEKVLKSAGNKVTLLKVKPKKELKAGQYDKNGKNLPLASKQTDLKEFDLVLAGTPVWNFSPSPIISAYLREAKNAKNKKFALFATCTAMSGSTILKMSNILTTRGAKIVDSLTVKSIFALDKEKLKEFEKFAKELSEKKF